MRAFEINLPLHDNSGHALDGCHSAFQQACLLQAGGYTKRPSSEGAWRDEATGQVHYDRIVQYMVVCTVETFEHLKAQAFSLFADQIAILWRDLGEATIERRPSGRASDRAHIGQGGPRTWQ